MCIRDRDIRACAAQADYQKRIIQLFHPVDRDIQLLIHDDVALNRCFGPVSYTHLESFSIMEYRYRGRPSQAVTQYM